MTKATELAKLREPFPAETIGKLPRISCKDCRDAQGKVCQKHQKQKCRECDNYITTAHLHLDYVGHAEVTDRLLSVDPEWTWEPFSVDERGLPAFILNQQGAPVGLWIRLTVLGVTRVGYGSVEGYKTEAVKELIGDALRNASMRFGVALDLWSKADLESGLQDSQAGSSQPSSVPPEREGSATSTAEPQPEGASDARVSGPSGSPPWWRPLSDQYGATKVKEIATAFSKTGAKVTKLEQLDNATPEQQEQVRQALADSDWAAPVGAK